jgi:lysophospholipid acyltransferase (LPLAT)-like uncharacterized protein
MKDRTPLWLRGAGMLSAQGLHAWMGTLEYRAMFYDRSVDAIYESPTPRIYIFWHEYILIPLYIRGNCNLTMLLSRHRDADILARVARHMGHECVRGSTYRGGSAAIIELARRGRHMHMAITPDGPRGPRRQLAQGPIFLASRLGLPIVPMGLGFDRPWRTPTWDKFAVPRPFSRARGVVGPEVYIPPDLDRDGMELHRQAVERLLTEMTVEAETWAASGERRAGSITVARQSRILGAGSMYGETGVARMASPPVADEPTPVASSLPLRQAA